MSKLILTFLTTALLLVTLSIGAALDSKQDREELRLVKLEQARLNATERLLGLKKMLNIKQNQIKAWEAYKKHVQDNSGIRMRMVDELRRKHDKTGKLPTSIELSQANISRLEHNLAVAKEQLAIFSELYKILDAEQKATIDKLALRKVQNEARKARRNYQQKPR